MKVSWNNMLKCKTSLATTFQNATSNGHACIDATGLRIASIQIATKRGTKPYPQIPHSVQSTHATVCWKWAHSSHLPSLVANWIYHKWKSKFEYCRIQKYRRVNSKLDVENRVKSNYNEYTVWTIRMKVHLSRSSTIKFQWKSFVQHEKNTKRIHFCRKFDQNAFQSNESIHRHTHIPENSKQTHTQTRKLIFKQRIDIIRISRTPTDILALQFQWHRIELYFRCFALYQPFLFCLSFSLFYNFPLCSTTRKRRTVTKLPIDYSLSLTYLFFCINYLLCVQ